MSRLRNKLNKELVSTIIFHEMDYVEFALQPQHETLSDSRIHLISDASERNLSRKRPRSLSLLSVHSSDWMTTGKLRLYKLSMMELPIKGSRLNNMKT